MSRLPVRTGADVHLADAFDLPGCPLCREQDRTEAAWLESILAESVNDVPFRARLDAGRGFCGRHARAFLDADMRRSGTLGAAILLRASLAVRLKELETASGSRGWSRPRKTADAARPPDCPACARLAEADGWVVDGLVELCKDPGWAEATATAEICLEHLVRLMDRRTVPAWWPPVETRQLERLSGIRDRLERFAHASSHDRAHLQTDDQRAAVGEAADLLGGRAGRASDRTDP
jgi:hypothetical protein